MIAWSLAWAVSWTAATWGPEPEDLIARLGSGDFDERVAAAEALESLGDRAVPALLDARGSGDLRVRRRAEALLDRIAVDRLGRPTMVRLDFRDRPLEEVIATLNERHDLRLELWLDPPAGRRRGMWPGMRADPAWKRRVEQQPVTLEAPEPVPFWEAIGRLGIEGGLLLEVMPWERLGPRLGPYRLFAGRGGEEFASDDGPYRAVVTRVGAGGDGVAVDLAILPEPGLTLVRLGPAELTEAVDDQGRSLLPPPGGEARGASPPRPRHADLTGPVGVTARLQLDRPQPPGRSIARLRGRIPALAVAGRPDPLTIPLESADGRVFRTGEIALTVHEVQRDPDGGKVVAVEVGVSPLRPYDRTAAGWSRVGDPDLTTYRGSALDHLDLFDADGREVSWGYRQGAPSDHRTERIRLLVDRIRIEDAAGPDGLPGPRLGDRPAAAELRFHGFVQRRVDVAFDLKDLPLSYERPNTPPDPEPRKPGELASIPGEVSR